MYIVRRACLPPLVRTDVGHRICPRRYLRRCMLYVPVFHFDPGSVVFRVVAFYVCVLRVGEASLFVITAGADNVSGAGWRLE